MYKHVFLPREVSSFLEPQPSRAAEFRKLRANNADAPRKPLASAHGVSKARAHDGRVNVFASEIQAAVSGIDLSNGLGPAFLLMECATTGIFSWLFIRLS